MPKATNAEIELRIDKVIEMLLEGQSRYQIVRYGTTAWEILPRQIDDYMTYAWDRIHEAGKEETAKQKARVLKNYWRLFQEAKQEGDRKEQHALINSMSKILGLEIAPAEQAPRLPDAIPDDELLQEARQGAVH